jgi:hypothetical protein
MARRFKFLCENCGAEVPSSGDRCPLCGHRCGGGQCTHGGATGPESAFRTGCPSCGYGTPTPTPVTPRSAPRLGPWALYLAVITAIALVALALVLF